MDGCKHLVNNTKAEFSVWYVQRFIEEEEEGCLEHLSSEFPKEKLIVIIHREDCIKVLSENRSSVILSYNGTVINPLPTYD
jgi:hypothetical protein